MSDKCERATQLQLASPHFLFKLLTQSNPPHPTPFCPAPLRFDLTVTVFIYIFERLPAGPLMHQPASLADTDSDND